MAPRSRRVTWPKTRLANRGAKHTLTRCTAARRGTLATSLWLKEGVQCPTAFVVHCTSPSMDKVELIRHAEKLLVVRDGITSFFYHPFLVPPGSPFYLVDVVQGLKKLGYQFVSAESMLPK